MSTLKQTVIAFNTNEAKAKATRLEKALAVYATLTPAARKDATLRSAEIKPVFLELYGEDCFAKASGSAQRMALGRLLKSIAEARKEVTVAHVDKAKVRVPVDCVNAVEKMLGKWTKAQIIAALKKFV